MSESVPYLAGSTANFPALVGFPRRAPCFLHLRPRPPSDPTEGPSGLEQHPCPCPQRVSSPLPLFSFFTQTLNPAGRALRRSVPVDIPPGPDAEPSSPRKAPWGPTPIVPAQPPTPAPRGNSVPTSVAFVLPALDSRVPRTCVLAGVLSALISLGDRFRTYLGCV